MSRALLIATADPTRVHAYFLTEEGVVAERDQTLGEVKQKLGDDGACFLCPTEWVSFIDLVLPDVKPALLKAVIPGMIEEHLAEPIENIHWATPATQKPNEKTTVAIIHRAHVENTINMFKAAGIHLEAMCPDIYFIPADEEAYMCWANEGRLCVRQDTWHGFALKEAEKEAWLSVINKPIKTTTAISSWAEQCLNQPCPINLLQREFVSQARRRDKNLLTQSIYALSGACVFYFVYLIVAGAILSHRLTALQAETLALYQQAIPGATQATSPRVVLGRELQKRGQSNHRFFTLLMALGEGLSRAPEIKLVNIQFEGDHLFATVEAKDFATLDAWTNSFSNDKTGFKQDSAEQSGDHVTAHIQWGAQ